MAEAMGVADDIDVYTGNFSKAFGSQGGYIASTAAVKQLLVNAGRSYVYSTALPVPVVHASLEALRVVHEVCLHVLMCDYDLHDAGAGASSAPAAQHGPCVAWSWRPCGLAHRAAGGG